jgi:hypothetical protein
MARILFPQDQEPLLVWKRERVQDQRIKRTENGGIGSDTQGQGEHRNHGKARVFDEGANGESQIPPQ